MMRKALARSVLCGLLVLAAQTASAIDACVHNANGALRILPPDGQCRNNEVAIELAAPQAPTGISKAVHGSVGFGAGGITTSGSGFSLDHTLNTGHYDIHFDTAFDVAPHCLVNAEFFSPCVGTSATPERLAVECATYVPAEGSSGPFIAIRLVDQPFQFLCVQE